VADPHPQCCQTRRRGSGGYMVTRDGDPRLVKLVQQADEERQRRIHAERSASVLKAMNVKLREQLRTVTRDRASDPQQAGTSDASNLR
jgi:hypothetical protein